MRRIFILLAIVCISLVFYLSWIPNPAMTGIQWLPRWLGVWADEFPRFRTAVPFLGLGGLCGMILISTGRRKRDWLIAWVGLTGLTMVCELGQLLIPRRVFDPIDVFWGSSGAAMGLALTMIVNHCRIRRSEIRKLTETSNRHLQI